MFSLKFGDEIPLESFRDQSGVLSIFEPSKIGGFEIKRVYFLHSLGGGSRGGHAHRELHQVLIAVSGRLTLELINGGVRKVLTLDNPEVGTYIPPLTWRELSDFSTNTVCLVLASHEFSEADYIRDREVFDQIP